jgi:adenylate kinase
MDAGGLVSDDIVIALIEERLQDGSTQRGAIFDGFPRTVAQAEALDAMLARHGRKLDRAVLVDVPDGVVEERNAGRRICTKCQHTYHLIFHPPKVDGVCDLDGSPLMQRPDDKLEKIRARLEVYHREPMIPYYEKKGMLHRVDGVGALDEVFERLVAAVDA